MKLKQYRCLCFRDKWTNEITKYYTFKRKWMKKVWFSISIALFLLLLKALYSRIDVSGSLCTHTTAHIHNQVTLYLLENISEYLKETLDFF